MHAWWWGTSMECTILIPIIANYWKWLATIRWSGITTLRGIFTESTAWSEKCLQFPLLNSSDILLVYVTYHVLWLLLFFFYLSSLIGPAVCLTFSVLSQKDTALGMRSSCKSNNIIEKEINAPSNHYSSQNFTTMTATAGQLVHAYLHKLPFLLWQVLHAYTIHNMYSQVWINVSFLDNMCWFYVNMMNDLAKILISLS